MNGTSATLFSPNGIVTRGMVVTVLYRMEGEPDVSDLENPFDDVAEGKYFTEAVIWAAENGVVLGYGGGKYGPDDNVTREQLAAILYRYQQLQKRYRPVTVRIAYLPTLTLSVNMPGFLYKHWLFKASLTVRIITCSTRKAMRPGLSTRQC